MAYLTRIFRELIVQERSVTSRWAALVDPPSFCARYTNRAVNFRSHLAPSLTFL